MIQWSFIVQETMVIRNAHESLEFSNGKKYPTKPRGLGDYFRYINSYLKFDPRPKEFSTDVLEVLNTRSSLGITLHILGKSSGKPWGKLLLLLRKIK